MRQFARFLFLAAALVVAWSFQGNVVLAGFPFGNETFTQEMERAHMDVMAKLVKRPDVSKTKANTSDPELAPKATFEIYHILKGEKLCKVGEKVEAGFRPHTDAEDAKVGEKFLLFGYLDRDEGAATPTKKWIPSGLSDNLEAFIHDLLKAPKDPIERMLKMQKYLADTDYSVQHYVSIEFDEIETRDLIKVKDKFNIDPIRKAVMDPARVPKTNSYLLALNYKLLGICGDQSDAKFFEARLSKTDDVQKKRLDALISAYLTLKKEAGSDLVEKKILMPALEKEDYPRVNSVIIALRFHGDEELFIKKEKIAPILAKVLEYPKRADLVILDLARWKHWESAERIMRLYRETSEDDNPFLREPAIAYMHEYLIVVPKSEAVKGYLAEMERIDPNAFTRAKLFLPQFLKKLVPKTKDAAVETSQESKEKSATDDSKK